MPPNQAAALPKTPKLTIVLTGGGSGGHITPLLSLAHELKTQNPKCKIIYIGLKGEKVEGLQSQYQAFDQVCTVAAGKLRRYHGQSSLAYLTDLRSLFLNIRDFFRVISGFFSSRHLLKKFKPQVVFSKGGFVAVPVGLAAKSLKIPIVTHDSDAIPGLANRIVGRWAVVHATGLSADNYPYPPATTREVGIPVDQRLKKVTPELQEKYRRDLELPKESQVLLVGGAGLGSQTLNDLTVEAAPQLLSRLPGLHIVHLTGTKHLSHVQGYYRQKLDPESQDRLMVLDFTSDFYRYTGAADLIITRAGATTLAELAIQAKACLLIPAAFLTGGHQQKNAEILKQKGAVEVLEEPVLPAKFVEMVNMLLTNESKRRALAEKLHQTAQPEAATNLATILLEVASQKNNQHGS